jgi:hypothetical protein
MFLANVKPVMEIAPSAALRVDMSMVEDNTAGYIEAPKASSVDVDASSDSDIPF